jgi:uridylate kinase
MQTIKYQQPLLKLSGEMFGGKDGYGFDGEALTSFALEIKELVELGVTPGIVIGGGNFFRGAQSTLPALQRHNADSIGMLATVMNSICFADHLRAVGVKTVVFSAMTVGTFTQLYDINLARQLLKEKTVCVFSGGTGHPYFSTDSGSALRAIEVGCDLLVKATKVDGVYDSDPAKNPDAKKYHEITYEEILDKKLGVMDLVAITLCRDNKLPLKVLSLKEKGILAKACKGLAIGTNVVEKI